MAQRAPAPSVVARDARARPSARERARLNVRGRSRAPQREGARRCDGRDGSLDPRAADGRIQAFLAALVSASKS